MAKSIPTVNFEAAQEAIFGQFRGLNPNDPSGWPIVPRVALFLGVIISVTVVLWFVWLNGEDAELEAAVSKEVALRTDYSKKLGQAVNLEALRKAAVEHGLGW